MSQLVNPYKWNVYSNFYTSNGPEGEILVDYARKEWNGEPHHGELPTQIIEEIVEHGKMAVEDIEKAAPFVKNNKKEFARSRNDEFVNFPELPDIKEPIKKELKIYRNCEIREDFQITLAEIQKLYQWYINYDLP